MNEAEIRKHNQTSDGLVENCRSIGFTRNRRIGRSTVARVMRLPNNDTTIEQALHERDAYNANLVAINNLRQEIGKSALRGSHDTLNQLETMLLGQNNQIKKGLLTLSEIQGKNQSEFAPK